MRCKSINNRLYARFAKFNSFKRLTQEGMTIIFRYFILEYTKKLLSILGIVVFIILITNIFDTLTKFKAFEISALDLASLIVYKIPYLVAEISPIICMLASLIFLSHLLKSNQIINIFNNGFSLIFTVKVVSFVNIIFAGIVLAVISPLGSILLNKYEILEKTLNSGPNLFYSNLLIKDGDAESQKFIYIGRMDVKTHFLKDVIILSLKKGAFDRRLNCKSAVIEKGFWRIKDCIKYTQDNSVQVEDYILHTNLVVKDILSYSSQIYNVPVWEMPQIIVSSEKLGMQTSLLELYYYKQLFRPLIIILLGLVPFYFFKADKTKIWSNTVDSLVIGIVLFLCINIATNFLLQYVKSAIISNSLPIFFFMFLMLRRLNSSYKYPI